MIRWIISPKGGSNPIPATKGNPLVRKRQGICRFWAPCELQVKNLTLVANGRLALGHSDKYLDER